MDELMRSNNTKQTKAHAIITTIGKAKGVEDFVNIFFKPMVAFAETIERNSKSSNLEFQFYKSIATFERKVEKNIADNPDQSFEEFIHSALYHKYSIRELIRIYNEFTDMAFAPNIMAQKIEFDDSRVIFDAIYQSPNCHPNMKLDLLLKISTRNSLVQKQTIAAIGSYNILIERNRKGAELSRYAFKFIGENIGAIYEKSIRMLSELICTLEGKTNPHVLKANSNIITKFCVQNRINSSNFKFDEMRIYKNGSSHGQFEIDPKTNIARIYNLTPNNIEEAIMKSPSDLLKDAEWLMNYQSQDLEFMKYIQSRIFRDRQIKKAFIKMVIHNFLEVSTEPDANENKITPNNALPL